MGQRTKDTEADAYDKAGDEAATRGQHNSAEMFYGMAAGERVEADRARRREVSTRTTRHD